MHVPLADALADVVDGPDHRRQDHHRAPAHRAPARRRAMTPARRAGAELPLEVEEFLTWLAVERGRSANTLAAYRRDLAPTPTGWAPEACGLDDVTEADVERLRGGAAGRRAGAGVSGPGAGGGALPAPVPGRRRVGAGRSGRRRGAAARAGRAAQAADRDRGAARCSTPSWATTPVAAARPGHPRGALRHRACASPSCAACPSATSTSTRRSSGSSARAPRSGSSRSGARPDGAARRVARASAGAPAFVPAPLGPPGRRRRRVPEPRGGRLSRQGAWAIVRAYGDPGRARRAALAPRPAPLLRHPHARPRRRHPRRAGAARPRLDLDHPGVHAVSTERLRAVYDAAHPRARRRGLE